LALALKQSSPFRTLNKNIFHYRPPRPLSAADAKDLKISMHDFTVKSRQKTMFASRKTTILFAADVNQNNEVKTFQEN